jgi:hypothetical protein
MAKSNKTLPLILAFMMTAGLFAVAASVVWLGLRSKSTFGQSSSNVESSSTSASTPATTPTSPKPRSLNEVPLKSDRSVDYSQLRDYLRAKNWKAADRETYLRMLDAAGPKAQATGMTPQDEMNTLSCNDLRTIDQLWNIATDGQQGFSVQMQILRGLGSDYRKLYEKVGWQKLPPSNQWLFELDYNPKNQRMESKPGKEPNYANPPAGHLPTVEIGYNLDVAFSGALKRCNF